MIQFKKKVLIIVVNTDDESFGCGGLIKKLSTKKNIVKEISFTKGVSSRNRYANFDIKKKKLDAKINAIKSYKNELKKSPHSRSISGIKNLSRIRGNQSGIKNAEAYKIIRKIEKS